MIEFIEHRIDTASGYSIMIMEPQGNGFVRLNVFPIGEPDTEILELSVAEVYRRQGIASRLMQRCLDLSSQVGPACVHLWTIKANWTYGWYQRLGFVEHRAHDTIEGAVWMAKEKASA